MSQGNSVRKELEKGLSNHKQRTDALSRIETLEARFDNLHGQLNNAFKQNGEKMDNIVRVLDALTSIVGQEEVTACVQRRHTERLEEEAAQTEAAVNDAIAAGTLVAVETAAEDQYLVVTTQKNADGTVRHPTRLFLPLGGYVPEVQTLLRAAKLGDIIPTIEDTTIEVLAIYKPVTITVDNDVVPTTGEA